MRWKYETLEKAVGELDVYIMELFRVHVVSTSLTRTRNKMMSYIFFLGSGKII